MKAERPPLRRREGSPWTGLWAVTLKELGDHLTSARMRLLEGLILLTALGTVSAAIQTLRTTVGEDPFLFLRIFTTSQQAGDIDYSFVLFLSFLIPLAAIALGFDAVNGEYNRRTLSRVLSQPIYRDALLAGKFLAGLFTLAITLLALWLLVTGLGIFRLGVIPSGGVVLFRRLRAHSHRHRRPGRAAGRQPIRRTGADPAAAGAFPPLAQHALCGGAAEPAQSGDTGAGTGVDHAVGRRGPRRAGALAEAPARVAAVHRDDRSGAPALR